MFALTSRRANSPDFSAKLPFLVIQPCLVYFDTNKPHFFLLQNTGCIRKPCHFRGGGASLHTSPRSASACDPLAQ